MPCGPRRPPIPASSSSTPNGLSLAHAAAHHVEIARLEHAQRQRTVRKQDGAQRKQRCPLVAHRQCQRPPRTGARRTATLAEMPTATGGQRGPGGKRRGEIRADVLEAAIAHHDDGVAGAAFADDFPTIVAVSAQMRAEGTPASVAAEVPLEALRSAAPSSRPPAPAPRPGPRGAHRASWCSSAARSPPARAAASASTGPRRACASIAVGWWAKSS